MAALEAIVKSLQENNTSQADQIAALNARLVAVEAKTAPISVAGTDFMITGKNVSIVDGSGATESSTGLGNLIVGYNEMGSNGDDHTGTHNLVVGSNNHYTSFGGLVAGEANTITGRFNSITGGYGNTTAMIVHQG